MRMDAGLRQGWLRAPPTTQPEAFDRAASWQPGRCILSTEARLDRAITLLSTILLKYPAIAVELGQYPALAAPLANTTMHLLKCLPNGGYKLVSFKDDDTPLYAILSHTWIDGKEVTYQEMVAGTGRDKVGFSKIRFCGERAALDGLGYFWVDTCCIDKSNSTELTKAINSMFRWYQRAAKCYVYLSDVSVPDEVADAEAFPITWADAFRRSRWFTRGWTLQELLAPAIVNFFSREGKLLGSKISLEQDIHEITKIPINVLRGHRLSECSIEERMRWTASRITTVKEDNVYCLFGIFGVYLPLIYGEGEENARQRLTGEIQRRQEGRGTERLQDLTESVAEKERVDKFMQVLYHNACVYVETKNRNRKPVAGTCRWFLKHDLFNQWHSGTSGRSQSLLYVTADPGCGKSVLSRYLIDDILPAEGRIVCYFFFKDDFEEQKSSRRTACTILHQLLSSKRHLLRSATLQKFEEQSGKFFESFTNIWDIFVAAAAQQDTVCVFDALDECPTEDRKQLLNAIKAGSGNMRCLLTSRPYGSIHRQIFGSSEIAPSTSNHIHLKADQGDISDEIAEEIQLVVNDKIDEIANCHDLDEGERCLLRDRLGSIPNRTYLWATLVFDGLLENEAGLTKESIINQLKDPPASVYDTYEKILCRDPGRAKPRRRALHIVLGAKRPLRIDEMAVAVAFEDYPNSVEGVKNRIISRTRVKTYLRDLCGLFISIVDSHVYLLHQTAREFLQNTKAVSTPRSSAFINQSIFTDTIIREFQAPVNHLKHHTLKAYHWKFSIAPDESNSILADICILYLHWGFQDIDNSLWDYAALYWVDHFHDSTTPKQEELAEMSLNLCFPGSQQRWMLVHDTRVDLLPNGGGPLHLASALGLFGAVKLLLATYEVDVDAKHEGDRTALLLAAENGHEAVVKLLLATGKVDVNATGRFGDTALSVAAGNGHEAMVKLLLATGKFNVNATDRVDNTALSLAAKNGREAVVKLLLATGKVDVNATNRFGDKALSLAAENGHEAVVKLLLATGKVDVNATGWGDNTTLSLAAKNGHEAVVKLLLATGKVDVNATNLFGDKALSLAAENGHEAVVKLLLATGKVDVDATDRYDRHRAKRQ